jgi:hypothetical protein
VGSFVVPLALLKLVFAVLPFDPGFLNPLLILLGAANLRWSQPPVDSPYVAMYVFVMVFVLGFADLWIACISYGLCL